MLSRCEEASVEKFFEVLRGRDAQRLLDTINTFDVNSSDSIAKMLVLFYEVMLDPVYLLEKEFLTKFSETTIEILMRDAIPLEAVLPGPFLLLFHPDILIRAWAETTVSEYMTLDDDSKPGLPEVKPVWDLLMGSFPIHDYDIRLPPHGLT
jgi:hypothetical protein